MTDSTVKLYPKYLMVDGQLVLYEEATVHTLSAAVKYAIGVFEGLRAYWNEEHGELYAFRVRDHLHRLLRSMRVSRIPGAENTLALEEQLVSLIQANELREDLHLRVQVLVDANDGVLESTEPVRVCLAAMPMGRHLERLGVHACVSTWTRLPERAAPPRVKSIANYHNGRLASLEAKGNGYDAAIMLTGEGRVAEGPGYNLFMVRDGLLCTPPPTDGILEGITRDSVIALAEANAIPFAQRTIDRSELYMAEELFFCGSAAEVTPILSVDHQRIGDGQIGGITRILRGRYEDAARGLDPTRFDWLTAIYGSTSLKEPLTASIES